MASEHESTLPPSFHDGWWHEMPFNCCTISSGSTFDLREREISRPIASAWLEAQPPALPILVNTSKGLPFSSSLIVTYRLPHPVLSSHVHPLMTWGRFLGPTFGSTCSFCLAFSPSFPV